MAGADDDLSRRLDEFRDEVAGGGFAQLLFNARGQGLAEIEDLLIAVGAPRAQDFYVRAIRLVLADRDAYRAFLDDWDDPAAAGLRGELQLLGVEYLTGSPGLDEETAAWRAGHGAADDAGGAGA
jgi:hypothetical protein